MTFRGGPLHFYCEAMTINPPMLAAAERAESRGLRLVGVGRHQGVSHDRT